MEGMGDFFPEQGEQLFSVCDSLESRERESRFPKKDREVADMAKPATPEEEISREKGFLARSVIIMCSFGHHDHRCECVSSDCG